ncbi:MAG: P pilus assembly chaperone PapD [Oceanospirillaceae bacterium]|jgi:P pilus assembly chaperone PapD
MMKKSYNYIGALILFTLLNSVIMSAYGISISARRLYLDPKNNDTNIRVLNTDSQTQSCVVEVVDIFITSSGKIALADSSTLATSSAKPLVRLAPRRFTLVPGENQKVKLLFRRKPGLENGEYQGALAIKCTITGGKNDSLVKINAALVHNVPLIVRTGKLPIQAEFVSTTFIQNDLQVVLKIAGNRSLTGTLALINPESGEVLNTIKDQSIYAQQPLVTLNLPLGEYRNSPLLLRFTEAPELGGDLVIEQTVN